jgi:hypothetical protein
MGSAIGNLAGGLLAKSSGGSAPRAPNLSGNISNANQTYNAANADATQTFNTATTYNQNAQNTLSNVVGQETPAMAAVNQSANNNLSTYGSTFTPLQAQQAKQAQNYTSAQNVQQLQGQAVGDSNAALQASLKNSQASLASEGVDPASIHGNALTTQAAVQGAAQNAQAANQSYLQTQATGNQLVSNANQLGLQVGAQGNQGAATGAQIGSGIVSGTNQTNQTGVNNLTAGNTYLNTGVNANQSAANIANAQFNQQQTAYQDQQNSAAQSGGILSGFLSSPLVSNAANSAAGALGYASGGPVTEKGALPMPIIPGTTDRKLAALTPGEYVIPHDVVQHKGHEFFHRMIDKTREEIAHRHGIPMPQQTTAAHAST